MLIEREVLLKRIEYLDGVVGRWMDFVKGVAASYLTPAGFSLLLSFIVKPLPSTIYLAIAIVGIVVALGVSAISFRIARVRREIEELWGELMKDPLKSRIPTELIAGLCMAASILLMAVIALLLTW